MKYGLLGEHLSHSYSPLIHSMLGDYEYTLIEKAPDEVEDFIKNGDFLPDFNVKSPNFSAWHSSMNSVNSFLYSCISSSSLQSIHMFSSDQQLR